MDQGRPASERKYRRLSTRDRPEEAPDLWVFKAVCGSGGFFQRRVSRAISAAVLRLVSGEQTTYLAEPPVRYFLTGADRFKANNILLGYPEGRAMGESWW